MQGKKHEIRIVARGRELATFRERLKVGQILRGRVLAVLSSGKIIINLHGYNMMAETRGVQIGCGQNLLLIVNDLKNKIELRWIQAQETDQDRNPSVSNLTVSRLLGSLQRIKQIILDKIVASDATQSIKTICDRVKDKVYKEHIFLPRFSECSQEALFPGEIITPGGGFPSILRVFCDGGDEPSKYEEKGRWFEFCVETERIGPMIFDISRNNGELSCKLKVLNEKISDTGKQVNALKSLFETTGYQSVEINLTGLNEDYPDILNLLDCYSEENINYRV